MDVDPHNGGGRTLSPAQAVALDGHGVVYSRRREVADALADSLHSLGKLRLSPGEAKSLYLSLQERAFAGEITYDVMLTEFARRLGLPPSDGASRLHAWIQSFSADIVVDPDLPGVLADLRSRGVTVGMVTNSIHPAHVKQEWLHQAGIAHLFDLIMSSVDERCRKPDPEIFRRFTAQVSLPPERTVFVGHDVAEVEGAKKAGMITICLRCSSPQGDYTVGRLAEVVDLPVWPSQTREKKEE
ncbi:HAD-IA family hydrolase [Candidatus Bipolaricaulota bacterium]|nr:HAD-IA family hydrolase [Candidatus Bipolaricaulota bacterium]